MLGDDANGIVLWRTQEAPCAARRRVELALLNESPTGWIQATDSQKNERVQKGKDKSGTARESAPFSPEYNDPGKEMDSLDLEPGVLENFCPPQNWLPGFLPVKT